MSSFNNSNESKPRNHLLNRDLQVGLPGDPKRHIATEQNNRKKKEKKDKEIIEWSSPGVDEEDGIGKPVDWTKSGYQAGQVSFSGNYLKDGQSLPQLNDSQEIVGHHQISDQVMRDYNSMVEVARDMIQEEEQEGDGYGDEGQHQRDQRVTQNQAVAQNQSFAAPFKSNNQSKASNISRSMNEDEKHSKPHRICGQFFDRRSGNSYSTGLQEHPRFESEQRAFAL